MKGGVVTSLPCSAKRQGGDCATRKRSPIVFVLGNIDSYERRLPRNGSKTARRYSNSDINISHPICCTYVYLKYHGGGFSNSLPMAIVFRFLAGSSIPSIFLNPAIAFDVFIVIIIHGGRYMFGAKAPRG
ncbi:hypothetical protein KXV58_004962 [Aspergillus fumigatus]|uniref:Uncharacterized protein n=2 Tax=Aspergillus fumigatus TaxID=746128 RepID=Q4WW24_ASPFU|nr:hypothetical protein AFUA_5G14170 [Aspergillus fumigatus Af293]KAH1327996.1 hypothetical protein KXX38_004223 [Aspergillus fumigatus]EAL91202.1 hypothetical protein AFUA_5G14170 [Aspergillus fumigatus Af293]KAH1676286.1 hypothetical protein KXX65_002307 [Aspergillus fumigatus]KAH1816564.1 hypothetical protein KXX19_002444 [Aspergillus fumigatus]KAH1872643.1 hypothetical protein KXX01_007687 [Aspergillus fumigatus]